MISNSRCSLSSCRWRPSVNIPAPWCTYPMDFCIPPCYLTGSSAIFPLFTPEAFFSRGHSLKRPCTWNYYLKLPDGWRVLRYGNSAVTLVTPLQSPEERDKKNYKRGLKYVYSNVHCTYVGMYISDLVKILLKIFQKYSKLCLASSTKCMIVWLWRTNMPLKKLATLWPFASRDVLFN